MKTKKGKEIKSDENAVGVKFWTGKASLKRWHWSKDKKKVREQAMPIFGEENPKPGKGKCKALRHVEDLGYPLAGVGAKWKIVKSQNVFFF